MKCWEERGCGRRECEGFGRETDFCWFRPERRCDRGGEGLSFKERFLNHCVECQVFADLLSSLQKEGSPALLGILKDIARRISMCDSALEGAPARLNWFADKITQLYELSTLMLSSLNVDRVLYIILTAVTSGQALGLNRAFLFTIDESEGALKGKMAVGPLDLSEASRIWSELSERQLTIQEIVEEYERHPPTEQNKAINEIIQRVSIPLDRTDSILVRSVVEKVSFNNIPVEQCADIEREFLRELRALTERYGALLIFDEVITGFRVAPGGAQEYYGVIPDLTALAKILAGGLPGGAVAGRADIMELLEIKDDKEWMLTRKMYHPGTYNANPLSAAAGIATLRIVKTGEPCQRANELAAKLRKGMNEVIDSHGLKNWCVYGEFSAFRYLINHDCDLRGKCDYGACKLPYEKLKGANDPVIAQALRCAMLLNGVDAPLVGGMTTAAHTEEDIERTCEAFDKSIEMLKRSGLI